MHDVTIRNWQLYRERFRFGWVVPIHFMIHVARAFQRYHFLHNLNSFYFVFAWCHKRNWPVYREFRFIYGSNCQNNCHLAIQSLSLSRYLRYSFFVQLNGGRFSLYYRSSISWTVQIRTGSSYPQIDPRSKSFPTSNDTTFHDIGIIFIYVWRHRKNWPCIMNGWNSDWYLLYVSWYSVQELSNDITHEKIQLLQLSVSTTTYTFSCFHKQIKGKWLETSHSKVKEMKRKWNLNIDYINP